MDNERSQQASRGFVWRTLTAVGISVMVLLVLLLLGYVLDVVLLSFAGILLAVFLRSLSAWVYDHTFLSQGWALAVVLVAIAVICGSGIGIWFLTPHVATQIDTLTQTLPESLRQLEQSVRNYQWGQALLGQVQDAEGLLPAKASIFAKATGIFSTSLGFLVNVAIVLFVGLFLAAQPELYTTGLVSLLPADKRLRAVDILHSLGQTLRWWLLGQVVTMSVVGVFMATGLWLLHVPLALTLGLLAALR